MELKEKISVEEKKLRDAGYEETASLLEICVNQNEVFKIGVVGEFSSGKSTFINSLIGQKILHTGAISNDSGTVTIKSGKENGKITSDKNTDKHSEFVCTSDFLLGKEIIEFHGLISKKAIADMQAMKELYMCDAAILILNAGHLLSEQERLFIESYSKYVNESRLIILINKIDLIDKNDLEQICEYAEKQMNSRYPNIKWHILKNKEKTEEELESIRKTINDWCQEEKSPVNENALKNVNSYIRSVLEKDLGELNKKEQTDIEQRKIEEKRILDNKELETAKLENILLDFKISSEKSIESIDNFIKTLFDKINDSLLSEYDKVPDKYTWYKTNLPDEWNNKLKTAESNADKYITGIINSDIDRLNSLSRVNTENYHKSNKLPEAQLSSSYEGNSYSKLKIIVPAVTIGGTVLGFCLFRFIGAAVAVGAGVISGIYLSSLSKSQDIAIRESVSTEIREKLTAIRNQTIANTRSIYAEITEKYKQCIYRYIESEFFIKEKPCTYKTKIKEIEEILKSL